MNTPVFDHSAHKRLWNWLAENHTKNKGAWPEWQRNGGEIPNVPQSCFACVYDREKCDEPSKICTNCPFGNYNDTTCLDGLFNSWCCSWREEDRKELALRIANLLIRTDIIVETK